MNYVGIPFGINLIFRWLNQFCCKRKFNEKDAQKDIQKNH